MDGTLEEKEKRKRLGSAYESKIHGPNAKKEDNAVKEADDGASKLVSKAEGETE